ncbi:MAG: type II/IV secretion system ATPase subunit [Nitrosarchaeum sp.]|nr:type II/IV secretion system ATPase subunit [Nitrosarchaeum sp.]
MVGEGDVVDLGEEQEIVSIDIEQDAPGSMGSIQLSDEYESFLRGKNFDRVRIKTRFFTKEYDSRRRLLHIEPFFIDVRIGTVTEPHRVVESYTLTTGAHVRILERLENVGYIYYIRIPEMNVTFQQLMEMYDEVEEFKRSGETDNDYIKRWYLEYGILEHLLFDPKVLEINVNPPAYKTPIRIVHADYDECVSNIYPSDDLLNYLTTRLKISTGRPINKAKPQLDGEIVIKTHKARVAAIVQPFSVFGTGFSIRSHRENPWTLPLFMDKGAINEWFCGVLSLAISHGRSFLTAGPRGSGKTSLLGALVLEILPKYRIITIEDTQELPIESYKALGYDLLPLKVRSALLEHGLEMPFDTGLRTTLRLGDSVLIIGEIRSKEAKVLYEAMRVGAMSNVVAGTIHGDSPYGVFDRVVNDLGVPRGSFKVTDLIITMNQIKSPSGLKRVRRVLSVTEVLKHWDDEPEFLDILVYDPKKDTLVPTDEFLEGKSVFIQEILKRSKGYRDYANVIEDVQLRGWAKTMHHKLAPEPKFLEAPYISKANILFTLLSENLQPLSSPERMETFKQEFTRRMELLFHKQQ